MILSSLFKQTFWQIGGKVISSISTFIILGLVARTYKESGVGIFTLALTYLNMFNLLADFGFNAHVLKKGIFEWPKLIGARLIWSAGLVVVAILLAPFLPFSNPTLNQAIFYGSLAIVGSAIFVTCNLIFQSKLKYELSTLASSLGTAVSLLVYLYLSLQKYTIPYLLIAYLLGWVIIALASLMLVKKYTSIKPVFSFPYFRKLFKESWPIAATLALNVVYFKVDTFLLAFYKGVSEVGIYNIAYSVFQSVLVLPTFVMNAYYPMMLKSLSKIKLVALGLLGIAILGTITTYVLAPFLINLLTAGNFTGSIQSLQILSLGFPAFFISALLMWLLVRWGKYKTMLVIYLLGLLVNIGLNLVFIPQYSFYGASWITVVSEYLILLMQIIFILKYTA